MPCITAARAKSPRRRISSPIATGSPHPAVGGSARADGERGAAGPVGPRTPIAMGKVQMAKALLERGAVAPGLFPGEHIPTRMEEMS